MASLTKIESTSSVFHKEEPAFSFPPLQAVPPAMVASSCEDLLLAGSDAIRRATQFTGSSQYVSMSVDTSSTCSKAYGSVHTMVDVITMTCAICRHRRIQNQYGVTKMQSRFLPIL